MEFKRSPVDHVRAVVLEADGVIDAQTIKHRSTTDVSDETLDSIIRELVSFGELEVTEGGVRPVEGEMIDPRPYMEGY